MGVEFVFIYHRIMYLRLLVLRDSYIQKVMDQMVGETEQLAYGQSSDTDLFEQRLIKCLSNDVDVYGTFISVDSLFIDTIMVPLFYDGMVAGLLIWDLVRFGEEGMSTFEFIYSIIVCVLVGISMWCYLCIACGTKVLRMNISRR